jgi:hypothetical protein
MDLSGRVSRGEYSRLAARWRRLAVDATTPQTRNHLLTLARQCEFLAGGGIELAPAKPEEPGLLEVTQ